MKKLILSFGLIFVFSLYILHGKLEGPEEVQVIAPQNIQPDNSSVADSSSSSLTTPAPTSTSTNSNSQSNTTGMGQMGGGMMNSMYKDGSYTGNVADAYYGLVQVKVIVSGGKITDVQFLQHPSDRSTSVYINNQAMPYLKQETIQAQSANVNVISGATATSQAFIESLSSALAQAKS